MFSARHLRHRLLRESSEGLPAKQGRQQQHRRSRPRRIRIKKQHQATSRTWIRRSFRLTSNLIAIRKKNRKQCTSRCKKSIAVQEVNCHTLRGSKIQFGKKKKPAPAITEFNLDSYTDRQTRKAGAMGSSLGLSTYNKSSEKKIQAGQHYYACKSIKTQGRKDVQL